MIWSHSSTNISLLLNSISTDLEGKEKRDVIPLKKNCSNVLKKNPIIYNNYVMKLCLTIDYIQ